MQDLLDSVDLTRCLEELRLPDWSDSLQPLLAERLSAAGHGDFERWADTVRSLTAARDEPERLRELLLSLAPWRKGPFELGGIDIDAEWRSDWKWQRLADRIEPVEGRKVLDVGCGNGYFARRMREGGASVVVGIDPTLLYVMQYLAVNVLDPDPGIVVLPLRLDELPDPKRAFDTAFSMGVLYHQRAPIDHLRQLRNTLRPAGQLVLETLFVPGEESYACTPADRYARMRNVWLLPTITELSTWLARSGYRDIEIIDQSMTTTDE